MSVANQVIMECDSTNDLARELALAGAPHGTWISSRRQGAGRGRLGRSWESIEGNLFLSIVARPKASSNTSSKNAWSWIPIAVAVATAELLRELNPKLEVEIKWPNDLWLGRKKLGGILCEAASGKGEPFVIIGLGLNCVRAPTGLDQEAASLTEYLAAKITADDVRMPIVAAVLSALDDLPSIKTRYERLAALRAGTIIEWKNEGKAFEGTVLGVGESGELLVRRTDGESVRLFAEDVQVRAKGI